MSEQPTLSTPGSNGSFSPQRATQIAIPVALSGVRVFTRIPNPTGIVALDATPGYLTAVAFSPLGGGVVEALGHPISAVTAGFPLSLPVHLIIVAEMLVFAWLLGLLARPLGALVAAAVAVLLNGLLTPTALSPTDGFGIYAAQVVSLLVGSAINIAVAVVTGITLTTAGLTGRPIQLMGPGKS